MEVSDGNFQSIVCVAADSGGRTGKTSASRASETVEIAFVDQGYMAKTPLKPMKNTVSNSKS
jgi:hypothetical protein